MTTTVVPSGRVSCGSVEEVVEAIRTARRNMEPFRLTCGGTWLHAGHPAAAGRALDLAPLTGVSEYVPGDLTLTARAGTTLAELDAVTAEHRQWLPLDPFGGARGTLGATLATASSGPLGGSIGLPRDITVGLAFVTGEGDIVRGGGRVVKNVAGFDLVRLTIGAWGTLGVITEATVRLRAQPDADETVALELPVEPDALATLVSSVRAAMVEPIACELLSPACANAVGLASGGVLLVRLAGNSVGLHHQRSTLSKLATSQPVDGRVWMKLRQSDPEGCTVLRISRRPSELPRLWHSTMSIPGVNAHATLTRGIVRLRLTSDRFVLPALDDGDRVIFETAPDGYRAGETRRSQDGLSRRLRDAFDPARLLNRGILGPEPAA